MAKKNDNSGKKKPAKRKYNNIHNQKTLMDSAKKTQASSPKRAYRSNKPKKKTTRKRRTSKNKSNFLILIACMSIFAVIIIALIIYTLFYFPKKLKEDIKNDLISVYQPLIVEEAEELTILKLDKKPAYKTQETAYHLLNQHYGIELQFEKIEMKINQGINKLTFTRNNKIFTELGTIYIFWDHQMSQQLDKAIVQNEVEKAVIRQKKSPKQSTPVITYRQKVQSSEPDYEQIEQTKMNMKKDAIVEHQKLIFQSPQRKEYPLPDDTPKIVIILDDVGYSYNSTYDFLKLNMPLTFALIPDVEESDNFYQIMKQAGKEMILHIPMEPEKGARYVEPNAILTTMTDQEIKNQIQVFLNRYPAVIGANNHMGSKAVSDARLMSIVLKELDRKNKIWVDSMTTLKTVSKEITSLEKMSYYERDVFLDNQNSLKAIRQAMDKLIQEAKQKGVAIGIGHVQTKNLALVLKEYYQKRNQYGIQFVLLSDLEK
ncbi:MAG: divergent polysaccharide deacetylase family protein [Spirochaetes bacterium]|nr:divergent polysaccharide deacetylase family protein [Spirochaetota bacterium]